MRKRIVSIFLSFVMLLTLLPGFSLAEAAGESVHKITSAQDLMKLSEYYKVDGITSFSLACDIDMSDYVWTPVESFDGTFDGNNHKISNLCIINSDESDRVGMFDTLRGHIKNLELENVSVENVSRQNAYIGAICGILAKNDSSEGSIENCSVSGSVKSLEWGGVCIGGLCGRAYCEGIYNCENHANVKIIGTNDGGASDVYIGGLCGEIDGLVYECLNDGKIELQISDTENADNGISVKIGGIAGYCYGTVYDAENSGEINVSTPGSVWAGGAFGELSTLLANKIVNKGTVNAECSYSCYAGGIAGRSNGTVSDCANMADVSGQSTDKIRILSTSYGGQPECAVGGILGIQVGKGDIISKCANEGSVSLICDKPNCDTPVESAGGILGMMSDFTFGGFDKTVIIENCYNTGDVSVFAKGYYAPSSYSGGIAGLLSPNGNSIKVAYCYNSGNCKAEAYGGVYADSAHNGGIAGAASYATLIGNAVLGGKMQALAFSGQDEGRVTNFTLAQLPDNSDYYTKSDNICVSKVCSGSCLMNCDKIVGEYDALSQSTYEDIGWDFENIWFMPEGKLPKLRSAPLNKPVLKLESASGMIISWNDVTGAVSYDVYRADNIDGPFKKIGSVASSKYPQYVDKDVENGEQYFYKVNAIDSFGTVGEFSECAYTTFNCPHNKVNFINFKDPTCTEYGHTYDEVCDFCGEYIYRGKPIDPIGHNYDTTDVPPSCTEEGFTVFICGQCYDIYQDNYVPALGHSWDKGTVTKEPTETSTGVKTYYCTRKDCDERKTETIPALKHTHKYTSKVVKPTASKQGYTQYTCSACGYSYKTSYTVAAPTITLSNVASSGKIKVSWSKITGAEKYYVYRATSKTGTYSRIATVTDLSYTDSKATAAKTYYYKVKAVKSNGTTSAYSSAKYLTCDLARPTVTLSNVASSGKIKLSWSKITGAEKYYIYRSTDDKTFSYVTSTTSLSYTDSKATAGKKYYYMVKAACSVSTATSANSTEHYLTCDLARPTVKITTSNGDPKLTWAKITGATKYEIYRATSKSGTYTKMYTTTKTSYTNTSATAGKTYYYKVKAVCGTSAAASAYSTVVSIKAK